MCVHVFVCVCACGVVVGGWMCMHLCVCACMHACMLMCVCVCARARLQLGGKVEMVTIEDGSHCRFGLRNWAPEVYAVWWWVVGWVGVSQHVCVCFCVFVGVV